MTNTETKQNSSEAAFCNFEAGSVAEIGKSFWTFSTSSELRALGGWTAVMAKLWDSDMVKSQCSKRLTHEILTSNECWLMHFKGRSALEYLGPVGLSCSGLLGVGVGVTAHRRVGTSWGQTQIGCCQLQLRDLTTKYKPGGRRGGWAEFNSIYWVWILLYTQHEIEGKFSSHKLTFNLFWAYFLPGQWEIQS